MGLLGRGSPFSLCSSCLPCKGGLAERGQGQNSPASTLYLGLGLSVTIWGRVFPLLSRLSLQPGLSLSEDDGNGGGDPQCRSLGFWMGGSPGWGVTGGDCKASQRLSSVQLGVLVGSSRRGRGRLACPSTVLHLCHFPAWICGKEDGRSSGTRSPEQQGPILERGNEQIECGT